jgi:hypothetical protein
MKKSQLQQIIREEIQNALNESIQIGWNGNNEKILTVGPTREKDGIEITNTDSNPGRTWFIPSNDISELISYLQSLNLEKFNPDGSDSELNPGLVRMVNRMKRR